MTPWMTFWERNYFAQAWPWLGALMESPYVRGWDRPLQRLLDVGSDGDR